MLDPLALLSDSEEEPDAPPPKRPKTAPEAAEAEAPMSFAELQTAGYRPVELLESESYLRDAALQEKQAKPMPDAPATDNEAQELEADEPSKETAEAAEAETAHAEVFEEPEVEVSQAEGRALPKPLRSLEEARVALHSKLMPPLLELGFQRLTPIQAHAIPILAAGRDLVGISATGSGKTLAYLLPALSNLLSDKSVQNNTLLPRPKVLVLGPTRELVCQIERSAQRFCRAAGLELEAVYGGAAVHWQRAGLRRRPQLVAATPGRMIDFLSEEPPALSLGDLKILVLDEADRMLSEGFEVQVRQILAEANKDRQTLLFSATWPDSVKLFARQTLKNPVEVRVGSAGSFSANPNVSQDVMFLREDSEKCSALASLLRGRRAKAIVFVATKRGCQQLERSLRGRLPLAVSAIHGDKAQREREKALQSFRDDHTQVLLATDVAGRGIDVKDVKLVVNFDLPRSTEDYIHRIGRTGRNGKGVAVSLITEADHDGMAMVAKVIKDSGAQMPQELARRCGDIFRGVDPRMHWREPFKGLDKNKYDKEDLKSAVENLWS